MISTARFFSLLVLGGSLSGCFNPNLDDGVLGCSMARTCPSGYSCLADNRCYHAGRNYDLSIGPFYGTGQLGDLTLTGSGTLLADSTTGQLKFDLGMEILPANSIGFQRIDQSNGLSVGIWNFRNLSVPSAITISPTPSSTGILAFAATSTIDLQGSISVDGLGARGGGPGTTGQGVTVGALKQGGTGADMNAGGGGGGGNGTVGEKGGGTGGAGGAIIGTSATPMTFGGGGGGGASANKSDGGIGGNGGGAVALLAAHIKLGGFISAAGTVGRQSATKPPGVATGGGGGGAGGSILLSSADIAFVGGSPSGDGGTGNLLSALGKAGADGTNSGGAGGAGGMGRISLFGTVTGAYSPTPQAASNPNPLISFPE